MTIMMMIGCLMQSGLQCSHIAVVTAAVNVNFELKCKHVFTRCLIRQQFVHSVALREMGLCCGSNINIYAPKE